MDFEPWQIDVHVDDAEQDLHWHVYFVVAQGHLSYITATLSNTLPVASDWTLCRPAWSLLTSAPTNIASRACQEDHLVELYQFISGFIVPCRPGTGIRTGALQGSHKPLLLLQYNIHVD